MTPKIVPKATPTIVDFGVIESGIRARETNSVSRNIAFSCLVLETIFAVPPHEVLEHITDGGEDRGIDFVLIDHGNRRINIGSCKTVSHHRSMRKNFPGDEVDKIISFIDDLLLGREDLVNSCNGKLCAKIREIWEIFSNETYVISVHLFSNQATLTPDARNRLSIALERHDIALNEYGLFELSHGVVKATKPRFQKKLTPIGDAALICAESGKRAIVTVAEIPELVKFLSDGETFDQRLIWQNVRYFLGIENEVNKEIRETLLSGQANDFWYLNSGLTIVCDQIVSQANGRHPISMVNPQIVNGCQTATVIHSVATSTMVDLGVGRVQIKIIETRDPVFVERIALASNTQSRILSRDLRANDEFQRQLVECLRQHGYYYIRKRGEQPGIASKVIDSARAGQLMLAYICGEPTKSKTDSNEIFGDLYEEAFNPHAVTPEVIIAAHECYCEIERRRREALAWQASVSRNSFEETWIIEGHFHLLFVVGELMRRTSSDIDNASMAIGFIDEAAAIISKYVEKNRRISGYRLFRLSRSRDEILRIMDSSSNSNASGPIQRDLFEIVEGRDGA